jgi:DNA gyrase subunit A
VRITGRQGMGVTLMRLSDGERVISCFPVADEDEDEDTGQADD